MPVHSAIESMKSIHIRATSHFRLFLYVLLGVVFLTVLLSCAKPGSDSIRFGIPSPAISLDPRFATDATSERINRLLYKRLVDFDAHFQPVASLASWEQVSPVQYRFHLGQSGRTFTNGEHLTSADVKATYDFILDASNASPHRGTLALIREIRLIDADTIDFLLDHADPLFPGYLVIGIVPESLIKAGYPLERSPVGSGDFAFVDWPEDGRLVIKRRSDGQVIEFVSVQDPTVRVLKLLRGEIDLLQNELPRELVAYLSRQPDIRLEHIEGINFTYLGFNLEDPVLSNLDVRKAIAHAIDRHALIHYMLGGKTRVANALLVADHWAGEPDVPAYKYDPVLAREYLKKAGYSREHPLTLEYKTSSDPFRLRIATIIQQQLRDIGIQVKLRSFDWATFYGDIKAGRFQLYSLTWVGIKSPDIFRYVFHSTSVPPAGANRGRFKDKTADRLIEQADNASTQQEQAAYYRQLQDYLQSRLPYVPLWYQEHFAAMNRHIHDYVLAKDGNFDGLVRIHKSRS